MIRPDNSNVRLHAGLAASGAEAAQIAELA
jgi:hypothetical protein